MFAFHFESRFTLQVTSSLRLSQRPFRLNSCLYTLLFYVTADINYDLKLMRRGAQEKEINLEHIKMNAYELDA